MTTGLTYEISYIRETLPGFACICTSLCTSVGLPSALNHNQDSESSAKRYLLTIDFLQQQPDNLTTEEVVFQDENYDKMFKSFQ